MLRHFFDVPGDQFVPTPNNQGKKKSQKPAIKSGLESLEERKLLSAVTGSPTDDLIDPQATVVSIHAEQDAAPEQNDAQQDLPDNVINVDADDYTVAISAVTMSDTAVIGQVTKGNISVTITNDTNEESSKSDRVNISVYARPVDAEDDTDDVLLGSKLNQVMNIGLEKSRTYKVNVEVPEELEEGEYTYIVVATTTEDEEVGTVESDDTLDVQEAFVNLTGSLDESKIPTEIIEGETPRVTIPVSVTNEGNVNIDKGQKIAITIVARPADAVDDTDDVVMVVLENQNISNLKPGATKNFNARFNIPADIDVDEYNFVAIIDSENVVEESDENDNEAAGEVDLEIVESTVDLSATLNESKLPDALISGNGDKLSMPITITNNGNTALDKSQTVAITIVARPADAVDDTDDVEIIVLEDQKIGGLRPDQSKTIRASFELPAGLESDDYILVAILDSGDDLDESDETNNEAIGAVEIAVTQGLPDLTATLDSSKFQEALISGNGDKISTPITITNSGNIDLAKGQKINITIVARPADALDDSDDVEVAVLSDQNVSGLGVDKTRKINASVTLPVGLESDDYKLVAIIDSDDQLSENDETNNEAESDDAITVTQGTVNLSATLDDSGIPEVIIEGETTRVTVPITITNDGNLNLAKGQKIDIAIVARPVDALNDEDDVLMTVLESQNVSGLGADASKTIRATFNLPEEFAAEDYNFIAIIDVSNDVEESDEEDNEAVGETDIEVVEAFVNLTTTISENFIPADVIGGNNSFKVPVTITNEGNVALEKGQKINISLFVNDTDGPLDMVEIAELIDANVTGLAPGASKTFNITVTIPEGVVSSTYEIVAVADTDDAVVESNENDNDATSDAIVNVTEGVRDLSIELNDSSIPEEAVSGSNTKFKLPVTITNDGNLKLAPGQKVQITVKAYRVLEVGGVEVNVPNPGITVLTVDNVNLSNLKPGSSKVFNLNFTLPLDGDFEDGEDYTFVVSVDTGDDIDESDEENNAAETEAVVTVTRGGPNLTADIDESDIPTEALSGDGSTIAVPITITNDGVTKLNAGQLVDIDIYIVDSNEEGEPVLLTTLEDQNISKLKVGASKTFLANVTLPTSLEDGSYKLIAVVDPENNIVEVDEEDNEDLTTGTIDLTQGSLDFSVEVTEESLEDFLVDTQGTATVTVTVANEGNLSTAADATTQVALFARLADAEDDSEDILLAQAQSVDVGALTPDDSVEVTFTDVDLSGLPVGEYILVAVVNDAGNLNSESENSETQTNDSFTVTAESNDLALTAGESSADDFIEGQLGGDNYVTVIVTNNGATTVPGETTVAIALFARPVGGGDDFFITVNEDVDVSELAPEGTVNTAFGELDLSGLPAGEYNLVAIVYDEDLDLASDLNNEAVVEESFTVEAINRDLAASSSTSTAVDFVEGESGEGNEINLTVTNNGNSQIDDETTVSYNVYARPTQGDDILLVENGSLDVSLLATEETALVLLDEIDLSELEPGEYTLVVIIDDSTFADADSENNEIVAEESFTVAAAMDIAATISDYDSGDIVLGSGDNVSNTITVRLTNNSEVTLPSETSLTMNVYARPTGGGNDVLVKGDISIDVSDLEAEDFVDEVVDDIDLSELELGEYTLVAIVDDSNLGGASDENNTVDTEDSFEVFIP